MGPRKMLMAAGVLCALALGAMVLALTLGREQVWQEFTPPPFDANAPEVTDPSWREFDAGVFRVSLSGEIRVLGNAAALWLTNPAENDVWMKLRILDREGHILGETGLIRPGEYLKEVYLEEVPPLGTEVVLKIMTYEPETYHSAGSITVHTAICEKKQG